MPPYVLLYLPLAVLWCKDLVGTNRDRDSALPVVQTMLSTQERTGKISHPTRPPEQLKPEAARPGNPASSPSLTQADLGSNSKDSEDENEEGSRLT